MNPYNLDITKIVKYACLSAVSIVGIIFGCLTFSRIVDTQASLSDRLWDDEE